jgi:hypothetical protein
MRHRILITALLTSLTVTVVEVYTTVQTKDLLRKRNALAALLGDAFADSAPLRRMIENYMDDAVIEAIAREHNKGRHLLSAQAIWIGCSKSTGISVR